MKMPNLGKKVMVQAQRKTEAPTVEMAPEQIETPMCRAA
jgi:hypothetical protein